MSRTFHGHESVDAALSALATASTVEQLRQAQAVVLPLRYGLNLQQTAEVIGLSPGWVSRLRNSFIAGNVLDARGAIGVTERTGFFRRMREMTRNIAQAFVAQREALGFPIKNPNWDAPPLQTLESPTFATPAAPADVLFELGVEEMPNGDVAAAQAQLEAAAGAASCEVVSSIQ